MKLLEMTEYYLKNCTLCGGVMNFDNTNFTGAPIPELLNVPGYIGRPLCNSCNQKVRKSINEGGHLSKSVVEQDGMIRDLKRVMMEQGRIMADLLKGATESKMVINDLSKRLGDSERLIDNLSKRLCDSERTISDLLDGFKKGNSETSDAISIKIIEANGAVWPITIKKSEPIFNIKRRIRQLGGHIDLLIRDDGIVYSDTDTVEQIGLCDDDEVCGIVDVMAGAEDPAKLTRRDVWNMMDPFIRSALSKS